MVDRNIISPVINSKTEIVNQSPTPNTPLSEQQIDYANAGYFNYAPVAFKKSVKGNTLETEGTIDLYDSKGNILQFTGKGGVVTSVIWGYNYLYPVAQVVGAAYTNVVAQLTGGSVTALQAMDGTTLQTELNNIRTNLPAAQVTSYTYKPMTGVTSVTDPNNKTNTYVYDAFNRLQVVKDQDGNAVKKNDYVYATPNPNSNISVFYNDEMSGSYRCTTCMWGYAAPNYEYKVPAGKYSSLISVADANTKAAADTALYGQHYVNSIAICSNTNCYNEGGYCNPATCTGVNMKCVYGVCAMGQRVNTSSVKMKWENLWICTYHYAWQDGSTSQDYTETVSQPCEVYEP
jgi:YD repeat-containing protein